MITQHRNLAALQKWVEGGGVPHKTGMDDFTTDAICRLSAAAARIHQGHPYTDEIEYLDWVYEALKCHLKKRLEYVDVELIGKSYVQPV